MPNKMDNTASNSAFSLPDGPIVFLSDTHLVPGEEEGAGQFKQFAQALMVREKGTLLIVGDFFDFWFEYKNFLMSSYYPVIQTLKNLVDSGWQVIMFHGNHDFTMGESLIHATGVKVVERQFYFSHLGKTIRVEHGDLLVGNDWIYTLWCTVMRRSITQNFLCALPPFVIDWIIATVIRLSRSVTKRGTLNDRKINDILPDPNKLIGSDILVCGHLHDHQDVELQVQGKTQRIVVLPAWYSKEPDYLELTATGEFLCKRFDLAGANA